MGRRKKEPEGAHREKIALAAERLFIQGGIEAATMNHIAKDAGYSKATLYVYFADKEEIVHFLVLKSMKTLYSHISKAVEKQAPAKDKYRDICKALVNYQEQYPLYFALTLGEINVDFDEEKYSPLEKETYDVGEQINHNIETFIRDGIKTGELQPDIPILQTAFLFWGALAGLIQMSVNKEAYIKKAMNLSRQQFLENGFETLYRLIRMEDN